jgi:phosphatidylserine decarboxylase
MMTARSLIAQIVQHEELNFLLTNRIPRLWLTRFMGWFGKIEQPLVRDLSIAVWRLFSDLDLNEAKKPEFSSVHDCFTRELKEGARPIDPDPARPRGHRESVRRDRRCLWTDRGNRAAADQGLSLRHP